LLIPGEPPHTTDNNAHRNADQQSTNGQQNANLIACHIKENDAEHGQRDNAK